MLTQTVTAVLQKLPQSITHQKLVVGVSGGPDSLALLHILCDLLAPDQLLVAHLDHILRPESGANAEFVRATAVAWGCNTQQKRVEVAKLAQQNGWSLEEAGRNARYAFFADVAEQAGATAVLVAHHADDQAETVLMNLLRGAGLAGLSGMRPSSPLPGKPDLLLVRPLLAVSRRDIEDYCEANDLHPLLDESNANPDYFRNRIRHELLPFLSDYNPHIQRHLLQLSEIAAADTDLLAELTDETWLDVLHASGDGWIQLDRNQYSLLPLSLQRRILRLVVGKLRPLQTDISFQVIEQARLIALEGSTSRQASLPDGLMLTVRYGLLEIQTSDQSSLSAFPQLVDGEQRPLFIPGKLELAAGWLLQARIVETIDLANIKAQNDQLRVFVDVGETDQLIVRSRQAGERFQPLGMGGKSATVQDMLVNRKVAAPLRDLLPVVALPEHMVWLLGQHIDERVKVTADSKRVVELQCVNNK